ncbi:MULTISPECIES: carbohydrate ABC transporter permease [Oceanobacillus]|uniref:Carbohydrate ABC transporter permease n=1 Tax=Oceanobacillus aidingensis TaxID=645964 RepID=A0ABV9JZ62_9BACI|nr:sugar ABC transporter permease [Oceanobacillus oncorhynchi]MDM8099844.1 sugar ABC transporter permease [Oceanobacillus oncorhynchi]UUI40384.1 sugar ABC transporter permease [Oceanobacillus oncorhynchi]
MIRFFKKHAIAYIFMLPAVVFLVLLLLVPIIRVFINSLYNANLLNPESDVFIGLENFKNVIQDPLFWTYAENSMVYTIGSVAGEFIVGLGIALLLNQKIKGRAFFRGVMIIPWVVPIVVAGMTWRWMLNPDYGIINVLLVNMGIIDQSINWLGNESTAMFSVIWINIWRSFPFYAISFLAVLQTINKSELEAAELDGANMFKRFWYITLPKLKGISSILIVLHLIWTFNNFDFIWILTEGGPLNATETLAIATYKEAFMTYHYGTASAISVLMVAILIAMMALYFWIQKRQGAKEG